MPDINTALIDQLASLSDLPDVRDKAEAVREACTKLRFHEALRRRIPEAAAESRVRGAAASSYLDGVDVPLDGMREFTVGAREWPDPLNADMATVKGALTATAESEAVSKVILTAPLQALARLHVAAAAGVVAPEQLGRPRIDGEQCSEFMDAGPAPEADEVAERLTGLAELITTARHATGRVPALVITAIVHGEIIAIRPFVHGNGLVARAVERALVQALGLDPTGVAVPESGHVLTGQVTYSGSAAAYAQGTAQGVGLWINHCADAMLHGVADGNRICNAVRAGRLR